MNIDTNTQTAVAHVLGVRRGRAALLALALFSAGAAGALPGTGLVAATAHAGQWVRLQALKKRPEPEGVSAIR